MDTTITLEITKRDTRAFSELTTTYPDDVQVVETDRLDGAIELFEMVIKLTPEVLTAITTIIVTLIRSRRHLRIKYKGIELTGISEANIVEILQTLSNRNHK